MRVRVSIDMEWVGGVADVSDTSPGGINDEYCRPMTAECKVTVEGSVGAGATDVIVISHGDMDSLLRAELDATTLATVSSY